MEKLNKLPKAVKDGLGMSKYLKSASLVVATKEKNESFKQYSKYDAYAEWFDKVVELGESQAFIRDGNHFCARLGLAHEVKGNDFQGKGKLGDAKFTRKGADVCIGGRITAEMVYRQCAKLLIGYHPHQDAHHITSASHLAVWDAIPNSTLEMDTLITEWEQWDKEGRKSPLTVDFSSEHFYIRLHHDGVNDDRFYVKSSAIKKYETVFYINENYSPQNLVETRISRFLSGDIVLVVQRTVRRVNMTIGKVLEMLEKEEFFIPDYQRIDLQSEVFGRAFIGQTIFTNTQLHRGEFMFHNVAQQYGIADGQQRLMAMKRFFILGTLRLKECFVTFKGRICDLSNLTWLEIIEMGKSNEFVQSFIDSIMSQEISAKVYDGFSYSDMAFEYRTANSGAQMKRQELRASFDSYLGTVVRHITTDALVKDEIEAEGIERFPDIFKTKRKVLTDINITTDRMNVDSLLSFAFHRCNAWGAGFKENEDIIDFLYEDSTDLKKTVKSWTKTGEYLTLLDTIIAEYKGNKKKYNSPYVKSDRRFRPKNIAIADKEEWDLLMFLILELKLRHPNKTLTVTDDVLSKILPHHYDNVIDEKFLKVKGANKNESGYGLSTRPGHGQRDYLEITTKWWPVWEDFLLSLNLKELASFGFKFE